MKANSRQVRHNTSVTRPTRAKSERALNMESPIAGRLEHPSTKRRACAHRPQPRDSAHNKIDNLKVAIFDVLCGEYIIHGLQNSRRTLDAVIPISK